MAVALHFQPRSDHKTMPHKKVTPTFCHLHRSERESTQSE